MIDHVGILGPRSRVSAWLHYRWIVVDPDSSELASFATNLDDQSPPSITPPPPSVSSDSQAGSQ